MCSVLFGCIVDAARLSLNQKIQFEIPMSASTHLLKCPWANTHFMTTPWVSQTIPSSLNWEPVWFWIGLLSASPSLHHISGFYIWRTGVCTVGLLLISGPEIGASRFPWLLLRIWQPFFHGLSTRGTPTPVFLVAVWNWRNSERGNLSREGMMFCVLCVGCVLFTCNLCVRTSPNDITHPDNITSPRCEESTLKPQQRHNSEKG